MTNPRQPVDAEAVPPPEPVVRPGGGQWTPPGFVPLRLVLQPGGAVVEVTRPSVIIGRHSDADVCLPLPDVSRRHCRCVCVEGRWYIQDLRSLNGISVNGASVPQASLNHDDRVRIGSFTFLVDLSGKRRPGAGRKATAGFLRRFFGLKQAS